MNTQEFMAAANIPTQPMVSYYLKHKIIQPSKIGKSYQFTLEDVATILKYKTGELPKPSKNLNHSTPILETDVKLEEPNGIIKGEHITLTHNVFGELVDNQTEPHFPATYSKRTLDQFFANQGIKPEFARSEGYKLDTVVFLSNLIKLAYKVDLEAYKQSLNDAIHNPDEKRFDKNYMLSLSCNESAYSYHEVTEKMVKVRTAMIAQRGYTTYAFPNFETFYIAFLKELAMDAHCPMMPDYETHWRYSNTRVSANYLQISLTRMLERSNLETIFEHTVSYIDKEADTYPATYHKKKEPTHGKNKPKALTEQGKPKFPNSWEDERYTRNKHLRLPEEVDPANAPSPAEASSEDFTKYILLQRKFTEFKEYYELKFKNHIKEL